MKTHNIYSFEKFHKIVHKYNGDTIYRGVSKSSFALLPKVGRDHCCTNFNNLGKYKDLTDYEWAILREFRKHAFPFLEYTPTKETEWWEWWAIAQHHGLPTRYLDWTKNPLVAAYFAVEDCNKDEDSVVYAVDSTQFYSDIDFVSYQLPLDIDEIFLYMPPHINKRIIAQSGIFTVHNLPEMPLEQLEVPNDKIKKKRGEKYEVDKLVISIAVKHEFKKVLNLYGINKSTIYPGLDGIASYLEWRSLDCN
jgi:hypothetical protein